MKTTDRLPVHLRCMSGHKWVTKEANVIRSTIFTADVDDDGACPDCGAQWGYLIEAPKATDQHLAEQK